MNDLQPLLQRMIDGWRHEHIPVQPGANAATISDFESKHKVKMPGDMKEFFSTVNGMGSEYDEEGFFRFWPIEEVKQVKEYSPEVAAKYPQSAEYFCFFDHSIDIFMYAIRLDRNGEFPSPIAMVCPQTLVSDCLFQPRYESFAEMVQEYVTNPKNLW